MSFEEAGALVWMLLLSWLQNLAAGLVPDIGQDSSAQGSGPPVP